MGACLDWRVYPDSLGREQITKDWADAVEDSLHESGHSYSGEIGMLGTEIKWCKMTPLEDQNAADDYISEHHDKWECGMAVPYKEGDEVFWMIGGWCSS